MKRTILVYGLVGGALIVALKLVEYRFLVVKHSLEIYGGIVALLFATLGIWLGRKLTRTTVVVREVPVASDGPFVVDAERQAQLGITSRELEILKQMAAGLSNKEIAAKLFVSENTVKTHAGSVFEKLGAKRRTQAVQLSKEARLIP